MKSLFRCLAVALATSLLSPTDARALVVDDFSFGSMQLTAFGGQDSMDVTQFWLNEDRTIGGQRNWSRFYHNAPPGSLDSFTTIRLDPVKETFELFSVSEDCFSCGYFNLSYGTVESPLEADLLADGADRFRFRFAGEENAPSFNLSVWAPSLTSDSSQRVVTSVGSRSVISGEGLIVEVPFERFDFEGEPRVDLTRVERIEIDVIRYPRGLRFELDSITTEPAPLVGDYNRDGVVDTSDYDTFVVGTQLQRSRFPDGELEPYNFDYRGITSDGNGDNRVDAADYTVWRDALAAASQNTAVPEPGVAVLSLLSLCTASLWSRTPRH